MHSCPPELHSYICQLACTDDGRTARSLVSVSTYFGNVARPFRYQSITLSGPDQISLVCAKLTAIPPHMRRIRHLCLSDRSPQSTHTTVTRLDEAAKAHIVHLVLLAAPTLETLAFSASFPTTSASLIGTLFGIVFPCLVELTIAGYYPFPRLPGSLPRLERLHLRGNRNPHGLLQLGALDAVCPNLTHLMISDLSMAVSFVDELEEALKTGRDSETNTDDMYYSSSSSPFTVNLPSKLEFIAVQPRPEPEREFSGRHRASTLKDQAMMDRLERLRLDSAEAGGIHGVRFILRDRNVSVFDSRNVARREWCDRLNGGDGCWSTPSPV